MPNAQDEQLIIAYILNVLDEDESSAVSSRLAQNESFRRFYRKVLRSLRPILSARITETEDVFVRTETRGLTSRTMNFIRQSVTMEVEDQTDLEVQMMETVADSSSETRLAKPNSSAGTASAPNELEARIY